MINNQNNLFIMGIFDFFRKKKNIKQSIVETEKPTQEKNILVAFPIFINNERLDLDKLTNHLIAFWNLKINVQNRDDSFAMLDIEEQLLSLSFIPAPIPLQELDNAIQQAYSWKNAKQELENQTGHIIISILDSKKSDIDRHFILTKLLSSIFLTHKDCIAVYKENQCLLLERKFYLASVEDIQEGRVPVPAWIYIGIIKTEKGFDSYTFGMKNFDLPEIEVINLNLKPDQLYTLILNISTYTISNNIRFKDGETFPIGSNNVRMKISESKGIYLENNSLKFELL